MLGGRIDRNEWALIIEAFIDRFDGGNKSAFATRIGLTRQTVMRWLQKKTDISPDSVSQVFDRLNLPHREQVDLLGRVGYIVAGVPKPEDPREDRVIKQILADKSLTEDQRDELVQMQLERIEADARRRQEEYLRLRHLLGAQGEAS